MNINQFMTTAAQLSADDQNALFKSLEKDLSPDEIRALKIGVAYYRQLLDNELNAAIKSALAEHLYNEFNKDKPQPRRVRVSWQQIVNTSWRRVLASWR